MPEKRFTASDKDIIAEKIIDTCSKRKRDRSDLERQWEEIDRQIAMNPELSVKKQRQGEVEESLSWMAETELPNQAETLEISTADSRRLMMPKGVQWFNAYAALTDEYLDKVDFQAMIAGDSNDVPSRIDQDNANKLVEGLINHWHNQYDFKANVDLCSAEAFKYSMGVGRARYVKKRVFIHHTKGVRFKDTNMPILVPRSIKNTYLDDTCHSVGNEGHIVAPGQIFENKIICKDLLMASAKGSSDVNDPHGGWIKNALKGFDEDKEIRILEWEGDMVVPRKSTGSMYLPNSIISVAVGSKNGEAARVVYRIRKNDVPYTSYILFPYHPEHIDTPYATSPLMKGRPIQKTATEALNRLMELAALNVQPPLSRDRDSDEEPETYPGALWGDDVKPNQIGDQSAMLNVYQDLKMQYSDITGTTAPRLGQQTLSHTTAYSKNAELARGQIRVNDYVDSTLEGAMQRWLHIEYEMGRKNMTDEMFFIRPYGGFVKVRKSFMPEYVEFEAFGAGSPQSEIEKFQKRMAALQQAIQMDQLNVSMGNQPTLNIEAMIQQVLGDGGWTDVDTFLRSEAISGANTAPGGIQGAMQPNPGLAVAALQTGAFGNR